MPKRFLVPALISLLLFVAAGWITGGMPDLKASTARGTDWIVSGVKEKYNLLRGGDLVVWDEVSVSYDGPSTGFYRDIPLGQDQEISRLWVGDTQRGQYRPGASAALGSEGAPGTYGVDGSNRNLYRIVWHHDSANETIGFLNVFRVSNVAERYSDADILRLRVWGDEWETTAKNISLTLRIPAGATARAEAAPHWLDPQVTTAPGKVSLRVQETPAWQPIDLLVRLPSGSLGPGVPKKAGEAPTINNSIIGSKYIESSGNRAVIWGLLFAFISLLPAALWLLLWKSRLQDSPWRGEPMRYTPPAGSLVQGYALAEEQGGAWKKLKPSTALVATLLDLVARGYYNRENERDDSGQWRLLISVKTERPVETLSAGEKATLSYFDELLAEGPCRVDDLDERLEKSKAALARQQMATNQLKKDIEQGNDQQKASSYSFLIKTAAIAWVLISAALIATLTTPRPLWSLVFLFLALLGALLIIFAIVRWPRKDFSRIGKDSMEAVGPWRSYRDFVLAFPNMNSVPDVQAILWDRAFAAALLYGVAREFVQRAQVVVPDLPADNWSLANTAFLGYTLGNSLESSATPANTSSSGGGFSSSGGGFGGGGFGGGGGGSW